MDDFNEFNSWYYAEKEYAYEGLCYKGGEDL